MEKDIDLLEYLIRGRDFMLKKLLISMVIALPVWFIVLVWFYLLGLRIETVVLAIAAYGILGVNIWCINYYLFYRIEIYPDGFYVRTNPFNAKYYKYGELSSADFKCRILHSRSGKPSITSYFLCFTDPHGKKRRIYFDDTYCINEMRLIVERISE